MVGRELYGVFLEGRDESLVVVFEWIEGNVEDVGVWECVWSFVKGYVEGVDENSGKVFEVDG